MGIREHVASQTWEPVRMAGFPEVTFWAWYHPPQTPSGVLVQVPHAVCFLLGNALTLHRLLESLGELPANIDSWILPWDSICLSQV